MLIASLCCLLSLFFTCVMMTLRQSTTTTTSTIAVVLVGAVAKKSKLGVNCFSVLFITPVFYMCNDDTQAKSGRNRSSVSKV